MMVCFNNKDIEARGQRKARKAAKLALQRQEARKIARSSAYMLEAF